MNKILGEKTEQELREFIRLKEKYSFLTPSEMEVLLTFDELGDEACASTIADKTGKQLGYTSGVFSGLFEKGVIGYDRYERTNKPIYHTTHAKEEKLKD